MRISKEKVAKRETRAIDLLKSGKDIKEVNEILFQEDGMRMALNRLYELRAQVAPTPVVEEAKEPTSFEKLTQSVPTPPTTVLTSNDPDAKFTTLFKGKIVTVELMEKDKK